jgi:hypothetical protein
MTLSTHYIYNSQGRCLKGMVMDPRSGPDEVVAAYLQTTGGELSLPVAMEDEYAHFEERTKRGRYKRYAVVASMGEWPTHTCPYAEEINDSDAECNCAVAKVRECQDDI